MIKRAFTIADLNFCQSLFKDKWRLKGIYYPVGPLIIMKENFPFRKDMTVAIHSIAYHEFLHHWHLACSSLGLLDLYFAKALVQLHLNFRRANETVSFKQPYIERLFEEGINSLTRDTLGGIVSILYTRKLFSGYDPTNYEQGYFPNTIQDAYSADSATRFRRNPPPRSDRKRQGVPIDSATPGRSVATLVF